MPRIAADPENKETVQTKKKGRPRSARPRVRTALSMRADEADLVMSTILHAIESGFIGKPASRTNGQPFAGVHPLLVKFCRAYVETHKLKISEYRP